MHAASLAPTPTADFSNQSTEADFQVTSAAADKLAQLLRELDDDSVVAVRVFVSGSGCSGMSYGMTFTQEQLPTDAVLDAGDFRLVVDPTALPYLRGVEIDYQEGPRGASFVFNNAFNFSGSSKKGGCGSCGSSGGGCG